MKRVHKLLITALIIFILTLLESGHSPTTNNITPAVNRESQTKEATTESTLKNPSEFLVTRVIDGDTIEIDEGTIVRYIGIDTPETVKPNTSIQCFGKEATDKNKELVEGKVVRLEKDVSETDRYGRLLRYVYVGDVFVNDYLVRQGYANAASFPPDIKYQEKLIQAQDEARSSSRGIWGNCKK